ncbi:glycoside hydrolase superfamily [Pterulicium gracile]|uniref:non-reducing end alpha-L-arabinofuranosidase n=1 Tax=Pterulicium gracile TaxID=1884261 RepID=A0A5C3Q814_9AGAR|nr:glycoside hydrolase superfamily [Pterula gracilis]
MWLNVHILTLVLAILSAVKAATFNVAISTGGHAQPDTLYGLMYEDINHVCYAQLASSSRAHIFISQSGDGGLYAELIQNRAFQQVTPGTSAALNSWAALNAASRISVVRSNVPVSAALPNALSLAVNAGTTDSVGFTNTGFWGFPVTANTRYQGSFYYRFPNPPSNQVSGNFNVDLRSTGGTVFTSTSVPFTSSAGWKKVTFTFTPSATQASANNLFAVSVTGATVSGLTVEFTLVSLFPPTFNNRPNGMRIDISQALADLKPTFFRFPGGNNLEGQTPARRWIWNNTIGDLLDRPGRQGDWSYVNTDGLGLFDYLQWIEDMGMEPIMGVWAGYTLNTQSVPENQLGPYVQEVLDQIHFAISDSSTNAQGRRRAALGHPAPFNVRYVEIGNEDWISAGGLASYNNYRWRVFASAISTTFPQLRLISTSGTSGNVPSVSGPRPIYWDLHIYENPNWFRNSAYNFDILPRNDLRFFQGEYAVTNANNGTRLSYPTVEGAITEAAYMTGFDRNSDIVFAAAYAPLLNHISSTQWTPNLISYSPNTLFKSTSYYVQQMFGVYKGDFYLTSTTNTASAPVQWSVTRNTSAGQVYLKVINTSTSAHTVVFTLPSSITTINAAGTGRILTGAAATMNTPSSPNAVVPRSFTFTAGRTITYSAVAWSASVLVVGAR